jgi:hypothetical protein
MNTEKKRFQSSQQTSSIDGNEEDFNSYSYEVNQKKKATVAL